MERYKHVTDALSQISALLDRVDALSPDRTGGSKTADGQREESQATLGDLSKRGSRQNPEVPVQTMLDNLKAAINGALSTSLVSDGTQVSTPPLVESVPC